MREARLGSPGPGTTSGVALLTTRSAGMAAALARGAERARRPRMMEEILDILFKGVGGI